MVFVAKQPWTVHKKCLSHIHIWLLDKQQTLLHSIFWWPILCLRFTWHIQNFMMVLYPYNQSPKRKCIRFIFRWFNLLIFIDFIRYSPKICVRTMQFQILIIFTLISLVNLLLRLPPLLQLVVVHPS